MILKEERIGGQRLILGDCLEVMPMLGRFDAVVTDPPYNFSTASAGHKHNLWADAVNSAFWFSEMLTQCKTRLQGRGCIWQFLNWKTFIPAQKACWSAGMKFDSLLVWDKEWIGPGGSVGLRPSYELVALMGVGDFALPNRGLPDIWRHKWSSQRESGHPAEKPISLLAEIIRETPGELILDPFMGSGTTLVACQRMGRMGTGIELDPEYFAIACKRVDEATRQADLFVAPPPAPPTQEALDL
jgi:site-specific DNA-methyltransferase (adenine-specific)